MSPSRRLATFIAITLLVSPLALSHAAPPARKHREKSARVLTGLDVLEAQKFAPLRGKHIGLITNHTGIDARERTTVDVLSHAPGVTLVALFSPEHGLAGRSDESITTQPNGPAGIPVFSLYGEARRPTDDMLNGIDALVFDVQDAGVRFYTYTTTLAYCMEEAAKRHIAFYVLDRPNPIGGEIIEGPILDSDKLSFVGYFPLPIRYGLTIGELAQLFNAENKINCDLHVIAMKGWRRSFFYDQTGLRWIPPSPNLRTMHGSVLYPGLETLQNAGVSVGRGTETPFEEIGAPWISGPQLADALNQKHIAGLHFQSAPFVPVSGLFTGQRCGGVGIRIIDRLAVRSVAASIEISLVLSNLYPQNFDASKMIFLIGNADTIQALQSARPSAEIFASWAPALATFDQMRRKYFLYQ